MKLATPCPSPLDVSADVTLSPGETRGSASSDNLQSESDAPSNSHHRITQFLAEGGLGRVFVAQDEELHREVVLKTLRPESAQVPEALHRFVKEAQVNSQLEHPNIVPIYRAGVDDGTGQPYYTMKYVRGRELEDLIRDYHENARQGGRDLLAFRRLLNLFVNACYAMSYAHNRGVVHRDLKPANIAVGEFGELLILDWGLAKVLVNGADAEDREDDVEAEDFQAARPIEVSGDADMGRTLTGRIMGTPSFMAPEQAAGKTDEIGPAADIYALGAILFAMLSGEPPHSPIQRYQEPTLSRWSKRKSDVALPLDSLRSESGHSARREESTLELLARVESGTIPMPRDINPRVSRALESICIKAMKLDPNDRYQDPSEIADEVNRWLADEAVTAYRDPWWVQTRRWMRRHRTLVTSIVAVSVVGVVSLISILAVVSHKNGQLGVANENLLAANAAERELREEANLRLIDMHTNAGFQADELSKSSEASLWFANAADLAQPNSARGIDNRMRFESWSRTIPVPVDAFLRSDRSAAVQALEFHRSNRYLMVRDLDGTCIIRDLEAGGLLSAPSDGASGASLTNAAWSPNGELLVVGGRGSAVQACRFPTCEPLYQIPGQEDATLIRFSPDGRRLALGSDRIRIWNCDTQQFSQGEFVHPSPVRSITFSPDSQTIVTACDDGLARVFQLDENPDGTALFPPLKHIEGKHYTSRVFFPPVFVDDGKKLLTRTTEDTVTGWDAQTGEMVGSFTGIGNVFGLHASPNGQDFCIHGFGGGRLWNSRTGRPVGHVQHSNLIFDVAYSHDSQTLLSASSDRTAGLWISPTGEPLTSAPHQGEVRVVAFSHDDRLFATAQADDLIRVWKHDVNYGRSAIELNQRHSAVAISADGQHVMPAGWQFGGSDDEPRVFDIQTGDPQGPPLAVGGWVNAAAFSLDGRHVLTASSLPEGLYDPSRRQQGWLQFWNWREASLLLEPIQTPSEPIGVAYSPVDPIAVCVCTGGQIMIVDPVTGGILRTMDQEQAFSLGKVQDRVRFAPDGKSFATWLNTAVRVWDTKSGQLKYQLDHEAECFNIDFSHDGSLIATASVDTVARVWNSETGELAAPPLQHPDWVFGARFSPDGKVVATASRDSMARLWDWKSGRLVCPAIQHNDEVFQAHFNADGNQLFTCSRDKTVRVWSAASGKALTPALSVPGWPYFASLTPQKQYAIVAGDLNSLQIFEMDAFAKLRADNALDPALAGEILAGKRIVESATDNLTTEDWEQRWKELQSDPPPLTSFTLSPAERRKWHQAKISFCLSRRNFFGALLHLDRLMEMSPAAPAMQIRRAEFNASLGRLDQAEQDSLAAEKLMKTLLQTSPDDPKDFLLQFQLAEIYQLQVQLYLRMNNLPRAMDCLRKRLDLMTQRVQADPYNKSLQSQLEREFDTLKQLESR